MRKNPSMVVDLFHVVFKREEPLAFSAFPCPYRRLPKGGWENWGRQLDQGDRRGQSGPDEVVEMRLISIKSPWVSCQVLDVLERQIGGWEPGYWSTPWETRSFLGAYGHRVHEGGPIAALGIIQRDARGRAIATTFAPRRPDGYTLWPVHAEGLFHGSFRFLMTVL